MRTPLFIVLFALAGCGDLSNEDILLTTALPDTTLELTLPPNSGSGTEIVDPQWELQTSIGMTASRRLNVFVDQALDAVQQMGRRAPTVPSAGHGEWSTTELPAPSTASLVTPSKLYARMTMQQIPNLTCDVTVSPLAASEPGYSWTISLSQSPNEGFIGVITGASRGLAFKHSCGSLTIDVMAARSLGVGYADAALDPVVSATETWELNGADAKLSLSLRTNNLTSYLDGTLAYLYHRHVDGTGVFYFAVQDDVRGNGIEHVRTLLQWDAQGSPWRADFCLDTATLAQVCGTACGADLLDRSYFTDGILTDGSASVCGGLAAGNPNDPTD